MNLLQLTNDALERCNYAPVGMAGASEVSRRMVRFLNQWHRKVCADVRFTRLRDDVITFASVANQMRYAIPPSVQKIHRIWETTNNNRLLEKSLDWLRLDPQAQSFQGVPQCYIPLGVTAITQQPATTGLWAVSSDAADTAAKVNINAVRTSGYVSSPAQTTLTGTTRVAIGTLTDYIDVTKFWLDRACVGEVSLYDAAAAGNLLAVIPRGKTYARYFTLFLWAVPSSAITYYVEHERQIQDMAVDTDEPLWPEDFHHLLVSCGIYQELLIKKDPATAGIYYKNEVVPGLDSLLNFLVNNDDYIIVPDDGRMRGRSSSNLGPSFPSGRW